MIRRPPRSTRTDTLFPYTTLFRSSSANQCEVFRAAGQQLGRTDAREGGGWIMGDQHCHCGCLVGVCAGKILWPGVLSPCTSAQAERRPALEREWTMSGSIRRCNDPAVPATSEERRVGKECVKTFKYRGAP